MLPSILGIAMPMPMDMDNTMMFPKNIILITRATVEPHQQWMTGTPGLMHHIMPVLSILGVAQDQVYQTSPLRNDIIMGHQKDHLDYMVIHLLHLHHWLEATSV